jgi:hypothetical protein
VCFDDGMNFVCVCVCVSCELIFQTFVEIFIVVFLAGLLLLELVLGSSVLCIVSVSLFCGG